VEYPTREAERDIVMATTGAGEAQAHPVFTAAQLIAAQSLLRRMPVGEAVVEHILDLVRAFRPEDESAPDIVRENVAWGPGPRAAQALTMMVRARALLDGRLAPSADDVVALARPVLSHRMALSFAARARGETLANLIDNVSAMTLPGKVAA
jgi:MoxR-like ATPase